ncbi:MAG: hypothetical protein ACTSW1_03985 [Candidatus Hodarchaeales archaeon]
MSEKDILRILKKKPKKTWKIMKEIAVLDTSFLVNLKILGYLEYICDVFHQIVIPPSVYKESYQFYHELEKLACTTLVELTNDEKKMVDQLHKEFTSIYPGKHFGEIEALVIAQQRELNLLISDNFAPWFIKKNHKRFSNVSIFRGTYFFTRLP